MARHYWLVKSDPDSFGWSNLEKAPRKTTFWDGVRNYQARNSLRAMEVGDSVFFYHSQVDPPAVMGTCRVARAASPDPSQFDPKSKYFDAGASPGSPRWFGVHLQAETAFDRPVPLEEIRRTRGLQRMVLVQKGRLSVQPVTEAEWKIIVKLGGRA